MTRAVSNSNFRRIDVRAVQATIVQLESRIAARFPESGLRNVARELIVVAEQATTRVARISQRSIWLQLISWLLAIAVLSILGTIPFTLRVGEVDTLADAIQVLEAALSASFFIGAAIIFLLSLDTRFRRQRALDAIHEMRAFAHVVDMHQLTKDPSLLLRPHIETEVSPKRTYTAFELQRYLDYCSEMLGLISKLAVLYVQDFPDSVAVSVVDDVEDLTTGLSRKIWQKIMLIPRGLPNEARDQNLIEDPHPKPIDHAIASETMQE